MKINLRSWPYIYIGKIRYMNQVRRFTDPCISFVKTKRSLAFFLLCSGHDADLDTIM